MNISKASLPSSAGGTDGFHCHGTAPDNLHPTFELFLQQGDQIIIPMLRQGTFQQDAVLTNIRNLHIAIIDVKKSL